MLSNSTCAGTGRACLGGTCCAISKTVGWVGGWMLMMQHCAATSSNDPSHCNMLSLLHCQTVEERDACVRRHQASALAPARHRLTVRLCTGIVEWHGGMAPWNDLACIHNSADPGIWYYSNQITRTTKNIRTTENTRTARRAARATASAARANQDPSSGTGTRPVRSPPLDWAPWFAARQGGAG